MKQNKTELVVVLDRSGSMQSIRTDMEGALKATVEKQASEPGECFFSLYRFDDIFETVFEGVDIKLIKPESLKLEPRGWTALVDALGKSINLVGNRLSMLPEEEKPETVIVTVITDGEENRSTEYVIEKVREMVKHQTEKYNWKFFFVGANIDSIKTGNQFGLTKGACLNFAPSGAGVTGLTESLNTAYTMTRSCVAGGAADYSYEFDEDDRLKSMGDLSKVKATLKK